MHNDNPDALSKLTWLLAVGFKVCTNNMLHTQGQYRLTAAEEMHTNWFLEGDDMVPLIEQAYRVFYVGRNPKTALQTMLEEVRASASLSSESSSDLLITLHEAKTAVEMGRAWIEEEVANGSRTPSSATISALKNAHTRLVNVK